MSRIKDLFFDIPQFFIGSRTILHCGFAAEHGILREVIPKGARVIDIGCGTGQHSALFEDGTYHGVDIAGRNLEYARRRYPGQCFAVFEAGFKAPFSDASFDWAMSFTTLHHVPPEGEDVYVDEIERTLKPGGGFLLWDHFPVPAQPLLGKLFVAIDRGHYPRMPADAKRLVGKKLVLEREQERRSGPYRVYGLVFRKPA
jgi:SAM-dependent methyltransferase